MFLYAFDLIELMATISVAINRSIVGAAAREFALNIHSNISQRAPRDWNGTRCGLQFCRVEDWGWVRSALQ
jgi:hypothetical protein